MEPFRRSLMTMTPGSLIERLYDVLVGARLMSEKADPMDESRTRSLSELERTLDKSRLAKEDTLGEAEGSANVEIGRLARTFKGTLDEWTQSVSELATWIRYSPPPLAAKPIEPWFEDQSEDDDDGGPETIQ